jgi:hypothetical protein
MRFAALVVAAVWALWLGACGARGSHDPAWPKTADRETDGGESIAPREAIAAVVVEDAAEVAVDVVAPAAAAATAGGAAAATPTVTAPTVTAPEDTITVEEIVIEINDE